jgi:hypothetical protein
LKTILTVLLFTYSFSYGQKNELKNPLFDKTLNKDSINVEFESLYKLTNSIHPGQFMFCSKKEFDKTYLNLKNTIKTNLSVIDYYKLTATLLAKIKDGHTAVDRDNINSLLKEKLVFPFSIYKIKNAFYLNKSTKENNDFVGFKLLKINGENINSIVKEVQNYIHLEGKNETGLNVRFRNFPFYYYIYNQTENFTIEYLDINNKKRTTELKGIIFENFTKTINENIEPLTTEIRSNKTAIVKFHSFENGYNETDRKIAEKKLDVFFTNVDSLKSTNLILDLRGNGGGAAEIANYLFSYLANKPYYYFDYVGAKFNSVKEWKHFAQYPDNIEEINISETKLKNGLHCYTETDSTDYWWFEKQQNKPNYFKGKISILIDGACFSTTGHLIALLRDNNIGTFYGEYSQGSNYSNSGMQAFILPYSKTLVWIPFYQFKMRTPNFKYDPKGIRPDFEIGVNSSDLKANFDRQLNYLIKKVEAQK